MKHNKLHIRFTTFLSLATIILLGLSSCKFSHPGLVVKTNHTVKEHEYKTESKHYHFFTFRRLSIAGKMIIKDTYDENGKLITKQISKHAVSPIFTDKSFEKTIFYNANESIDSINYAETRYIGKGSLVRNEKSVILASK